MRLSLLLASIATFASLASAQTVCNGQASFCSRKFSELAYVTTHNAYAYINNPAQNQHYDIVQQLTDGVRGFMLGKRHCIGIAKREKREEERRRGGKGEKTSRDLKT